MSKILVVEDEKNLLLILGTMLRSEGHEVELVSNLTDAKKIIRRENVHAILTDLRLKREDGLWLLQWTKEEGYRIPIIILTGHGTVDSAVDAMKQGAFDYIGKPFDRHELVRVLRKAILSHQFQSHQFTKPEEVSGYPMIGKNDKMLRVFAACEKVAPTDSTVLIFGESGTGKELVAQVIHEHSQRNQEPFIKINCAAIPPTLMESELFGFERGAFTGAFNSKPGRFELADKGTLFLDEIAEMSVEMQVKLLRVLQDGSFERVGGIRSMSVDVRLVAATNKNLEELIEAGKFREDLYYRLNVVPVHLPPLRDRPDDIPLLIAYFVKQISKRLEKDAPEFSPEALELLIRFPWPGNIRQLENVMERILVMQEEKTIEKQALPKEILKLESELMEEAIDKSGSLKVMVKDATRRIEKKAIEQALKETNSNVTQAAKTLNISRKGLQLKMKELGLR